jgi:Holliday junction resolvase-like predicted endonuclease
MNPREYEEFVAAQLRDEGFETELGPYRGDYGVDIIATRGAEKVAVQVKHYGGTTRHVNRAMIMELHGAAAYFDCKGAILATDGALTADASEVASRLGVRILAVERSTSVAAERAIEQTEIVPGDPDFEAIWERYVIPLQGRVLMRSDGSTNEIVRADWSGIERISSNGRHGHIGIEILRWTVDRIFERGTVTRAEINDEYARRGSSGVVLVLGQVPVFEVLSSPLRIRRRSLHGSGDS